MKHDETVFKAMIFAPSSSFPSFWRLSLRMEYRLSQRFTTRPQPMSDFFEPWRIERRIEPPGSVSDRLRAFRAMFGMFFLDGHEQFDAKNL